MEEKSPVENEVAAACFIHTHILTTLVCCDEFSFLAIVLHVPTAQFSSFSLKYEYAAASSTHKKPMRNDRSLTMV